MGLLLLHHYRFVASFAAFSDLTNDEHTRAFLCMEIGAGHQEVQYRPSFLNFFFNLFRLLEKYLNLTSSPSYVCSRTRLHLHCVRSAKKNIMNSHVSTHRSPGSSSIVPHNNLRDVQSQLSPMIRHWRIPQARTRTLFPLYHVSPRTSSPR